MENFNLMPQPAQPVNRITTGQLPAELAELSEETLSQVSEDILSSSSILPSGIGACIESTCFSLAYNNKPVPICGLVCVCSYDGDDAE